MEVSSRSAWLVGHEIAPTGDQCYPFDAFGLLLGPDKFTHLYLVYGESGFADDAVAVFGAVIHAHDDVVYTGGEVLELVEGAEDVGVVVDVGGHDGVGTEARLAPALDVVPAGVKGVVGDVHLVVGLDSNDFDGGVDF